VPIQEIRTEIPAKRNLFWKNVLTHDRAHFRSSYGGSPPWDIGKPQPAFQAAADKVVGSVLDAGCGTGEHALFFAARGHAVTGFDFLEEPIAAARRKAVERSLIVKFLVKDALKLHEWTERFDNVIDSGLFHVFSDTDRIRYVRGLENVLNPGASVPALFQRRHSGNGRTATRLAVRVASCLCRWLGNRIPRARAPRNPS